MKRIQLLNRSSGLAMVVVFAGLSLTACNKVAAPAADAQQAPPPTAALALANDPSAPPLAAAPSVNALPQAPRARVARLQRPRDGYAFVDRGYAMSHAFADAPPDYTFNYGGVRPWVWQADDRSEQVVEPVDGGDRYYYYRPGEDQPFLVRDPEYSYGFEGGQLVVVYDRSGRVLPDNDIDQRADMAGRYLARARAIYYASQREQRQAVYADHWRERRDALNADRRQWAEQQAQDSDWRAYHDEHAQYDDQWDSERYRRQAEAARYAQQANDTQAAIRFAAAAAIALQAAQNHHQGPSQGGFGDQGRAPFGGGSPGGAPGQPFGGAGQGPGRFQAQGPNPGAGVLPGQAGVDSRVIEQARQRQQALDAQAQAAQQAAAQQQARAQAAQLAAQQQHNAEAVNQARIAQQAAAQQQARAQAAQLAADRQKSLDAANQARIAQQAQAQQQARLQAAQAGAQRQQAENAANQARLAQQAQAQQQARLQATQEAAQRQKAAEAATQARASQQAVAQQQARLQADQAAAERQKAAAAAAQSRVAQQNVSAQLIAQQRAQAEAARAAQTHEGPKLQQQGGPKAKPAEGDKGAGDPNHPHKKQPEQQ